jgi:hypothetical protein
MVHRFCHGREEQFIISRSPKLSPNELNLFERVRESSSQRTLKNNDNFGGESIKKKLVT